MNPSPAILEHGERFGKLTVLQKIRTKKGKRNVYRCGCVCGFSGTLLRAAQLLKGSVTACLKCRNQSS